MSHLKTELGGKISSKSLKANKEARSKALYSKIEKKRKDITKHHQEKKMSGAGSLFD